MNGRLEKTTRLARIALLAATALALGFLESMIAVPAFVPGMKLGLANVAVLVALYVLDAKGAACVAVVKVIAAGLLFGSPTMLAYSLGGTVLSFAGMALLCRLKVSVVPTSMVGAILHNAGQLLVAAFMLGTSSVLLLAAPLAVAACVTGFLVGLVVLGVVPLLDKTAGAGCPERPVIDLSDLRLEPGRLVAFVGPNGSGKTTAALQLAGLVENGAKSLGARAGITFQNAEDQLVALVVEDDIAFGLENQGVPPKSMALQVEAALSQMGLSSCSKTSVEALSGGQRYQVAVAGLSVLDFPIMVFDEVSAHLDAKGWLSLRAVMDDLLEQGVCVILITQNIDQAFCAQNVCVFREGSILWQGEPSGLLCQERLLAECGLELPVAARLAQQLRASGIECPVVSDVASLQEALSC